MRILTPLSAPPDCFAASAATQAAWLDELARALAQCDRLLAELHEEHPAGIDATILAARVATMRTEIAKLQKGMGEESVIDPKWIGLFAEVAQTPSGNSPPPPNSTI